MRLLGGVANIYFTGREIHAGETFSRHVHTSICSLSLTLSLTLVLSLSTRLRRREPALRWCLPRHYYYY